MQKTIGNYFLNKIYNEKLKGRDKLKIVNKLIDWDKFIPIIKSIFRDNKKTGGRPHTDERVIVKALVLQGWYGLTDEELEYQINDRISFRNFVSTDNPPDFTTIWKIREKLKEENMIKKIWDELQKQLVEKGVKTKTGVIQDASFIETDLGRKRHHKEKKAEKEGIKIKYTDKQKSHINKDASFSVKNGQVHYGYKLHAKADADSQIILDFNVTTAAVHDSKIDLVKEGDIKAYRDKGYAGKKLKAKKVDDNTMKKAYKNKPLTEEDKKWNKNISKVRAKGERPFSVINKVFNGGRVLVKTLPRVKVIELFKCFAFNLYNLPYALRVKNKMQKKCLAVVEHIPLTFIPLYKQL